MMMRAGGTLQTSIRCADTETRVAACRTAVLFAAGLILHNMPRQPDSGEFGMTGAHESVEERHCMHCHSCGKSLSCLRLLISTLTNHIHQPCKTCNLLVASQLETFTGAPYAGIRASAPVPPDLYS